MRVRRTIRNKSENSPSFFHLITYTYYLFKKIRYYSYLKCIFFPNFFIRANPRGSGFTASLPSGKSTTTLWSYRVSYSYHYYYNLVFIPFFQVCRVPTTKSYGRKSIIFIGNNHSFFYILINFETLLHTTNFNWF